jgi:hypothetical protein
MGSAGVSNGKLEESPPAAPTFHPLPEYAQILRHWEAFCWAMGNEARIILAKAPS